MWRIFHTIDEYEFKILILTKFDFSRYSGLEGGQDDR